jgi:hypothetical protein
MLQNSIDESMLLKARTAFPMLHQKMRAFVSLYRLRRL